MANKGCQDAMTAIYNQNKNWVKNLSYSICKNDADAEEVVQEVFKYLFNKFPHFKLTCSLKSYLYPITRNKTIDIVRKRKDNISFDECQEVLSAKENNLEECVIRNRITEIVINLSGEHRDVIILRFVDGYSLQEISEALGIPKGTAKSRLHIALKKLKKEYPNDGQPILNLLTLLFV